MTNDKINAEYTELKSKSKSELKEICSRSHRVEDLRFEQKPDLIVRILIARYGAKNVEAALSNKIK